MKQVVQNLANGTTEVLEMPTPLRNEGAVLIATSRSLISSGTERSLVQFGRAGLLQKARMQPERVRMVVERAFTDGVLATLDAVKSKLDQPIPLGYCNVGRVLAVGDGVSALKVGDRVVSNGPHAEIVRVPVNLCARIPNDLSDDAAVFAVPASIALQGIRLAAPTLGETFVVIGLGLIGLLAVQLLRANGCQVIGVDLNTARLKLAEAYGAKVFHATDSAEVEAYVRGQTSGIGADGVLITAATSSNEPVRTAAHVCRKRGRIVLVGVTGLELSRADFYEKELTFQVSCSYGPGRYDPSYEEKGHDYPIGYVRWTEQRNFEAVLQVMSAGKLDTRALESHRFQIESANAAYDVLNSDRAALAILLTYPEKAVEPLTIVPVATNPVARSSEPVRAGFIGAGNYASRMLIPSFKKAGIALTTVATTGSVQGVHFARKFGFRHAASEVGAVLNSPEVNLAVIATRHDSHANLVVQALQAGKHVFVEKPLAITQEELGQVAHLLSGLDQQGPTLTVGFNRRFAPLTKLAAELLCKRSGPKSFVYTVNAGAIPADHWTQDPQIGGDRIVGEACHFIDLLRFLAGSPIECADALAVPPQPPQRAPDNVVIQMKFADGSVGAIQYFSNGSRQFPKERVEIFMGGAVLRLDNFRNLESFGWPGFRGRRLWRQDKGQDAMALALKNAIETGSGPIIPWPELLEVAQTTILTAERAAQRQCSPSP